MPTTPPVEPLTFLGHVLAMLSLIASLAALVPAFAAVFAAIWYLIQIYESDTAKKYFDKRRATRKLRRILRLKAEQKVLLAELDALEVVREAREIAESKVTSASKEAAVELKRETAAVKEAELNGVKSSQPK